MSQEEANVYMTLLVKPACDEFLLNFKSSTADGYESWRVLNADAIASLERDSRVVDQSERIVENIRASAELTEDMKGQCRDLKSVFDALSRPVNSRMQTPEGTWALLKEGLSAADRELIMICLTSSAAQSMGQLIDNATDDQIRQLSEWLGEIVSVSDYEDFIEAKIIRDDGTASSVVFNRNINGEWVVVSL